MISADGFDWSSVLPKLPSDNPNNNTQTVTTQQSSQTIPTNQMISPDHIRFYPKYSDDRGLTLYQLIMTRHPPSWHHFFMSAENEVRHACNLISRDVSASNKPFYPSAEKVLTAFWLTPLFMLRAVIIGQDPYPGLSKQGMPRAIGACFASDRNYDMPDSLKPVYRELESSVEDWKDPGHPDITNWGRQGVLLLNTALTVEANNPKSHAGYWKPFSEKLMEYMNEQTKDLVFLLWGKQAQKAADTIWGSKHLKLNAYHPSPKNAGKEEHNFRGCNHFNLANIHLVEKGIHPIDWRIK